MNTKIPLVIDTDAFNEIDDQFAIAYALCCPETFDIMALMAAPFLNEKSSSPGDGMEKSLLEIEQIRSLCDSNVAVFSGSENFLPKCGRPVESAACDELIRLAKAMPDGERLYVAAIAALTNVASALIKAPEIADRITVCWLGAHAYQMPEQDEFNLRQDRAAAQTVFDSGTAIIWFPCEGVCSHLSLTIWEAEHWLTGYGKVADALLMLLCGCGAGGPGQSRVIWDIAPIAYLRDPGCARTIEVTAPIFTGSRITLPDHRPVVRYVQSIVRDRVFHDFFQTIAGCAR